MQKENNTSEILQTASENRPNNQKKLTGRKGIPLGAILKLRKRGFNFTEIGMLLGITKQTVWKRVRDWESGKLPG